MEIHRPVTVPGFGGLILLCGFLASTAANSSQELLWGPSHLISDRVFINQDLTLKLNRLFIDRMLTTSIISNLRLLCPILVRTVHERQ